MTQPVAYLSKQEDKKDLDNFHSKCWIRSSFIDQVCVQHTVYGSFKLFSVNLHTEQFTGRYK